MPFPSPTERSPLHLNANATVYRTLEGWQYASPFSLERRLVFAIVVKGGIRILCCLIS
jgi:hypothetical protein